MSVRWFGRASSSSGLPTDDTGMVTAETAVALPALVLVLLVALGAVNVATTQLRCADAAAVGARLAARGEPATTVRAAARAAAPGTSVTVRGAGTPTVTVVVAARVGIPGLTGLLHGWSVRESFTEPREPGPLPGLTGQGRTP